MRKGFLVTVGIILTFLVSVCLSQTEAQEEYDRENQRIDNIVQEYPELSDEAAAIKSKQKEIKSLREKWRNAIKDHEEKRLAEIKRNDPERYKKIMARRKKNQHRKKTWREMAIEERREKRKERLAEIKEKDPERYEKIMARRKERLEKRKEWTEMTAEERWEKRMARDKAPEKLDTTKGLIRVKNPEAEAYKTKIDSLRKELQSLYRDFRKQFHALRLARSIAADKKDTEYHNYNKK
jgi:chromosome segregation ATPase